MADKSREELEQEANEVSVKLANEYRDAQREDAESAREDAGSGAETDEEYEARVAAARRTGIFGDTDTTAGAGASLTDVVSSDNEAATVAAAKVDAGQEEGVDEAEGVSNDEARRQVDVSAGKPSAEDVQEGSPDEESASEAGVEDQDKPKRSRSRKSS